MGDEAIELDEAPFIEEQIEPLAGGELSLFVLLGDAVRSPALLGERLAMMEVVEKLPGVGHSGVKIRRTERTEKTEKTKGDKSKEGDWIFLIPPPSPSSPAFPSYSIAALSSNAGRTGGMIGSSGYPMTASTIR